MFQMNSKHVEHVTVGITQTIMHTMITDERGEGAGCAGVMKKFPRRGPLFVTLTPTIVIGHGDSN